jgi:peptidoglycan-associated lipoprotein
MVKAGISPSRLTTISYGEEKPAVAASSENAWARNRRAEFKFTNCR